MRVIFSLLLLVLLVSPASAEQRLQVEWSDESLSVVAVSVPLSRILREIAQDTGVEVRGSQDLQEEVSVRFSRLPLRQALARLLGGMNYLLLLEDTTLPGGRRSGLIWVLGRRAPSAPETASLTGAQGTRSEKAEGVMASPHASGAVTDEAALRKSLSDPNPAVQAMALDRLAENNRQEAIPLLVDGTRSQQPQLRLRALDLLINSQANENTVLSALGRAVSDEDVGVKSYAIRALAERGGPEAIAHLGEALRDSDPAIKMLAIEHIARSVPPTQRAVLLQQAATDSNEMVRSAASTWLEEAIEK
jgi:HEAT repeat protein